MYQTQQTNVSNITTCRLNQPINEPSNQVNKKAPNNQLSKQPTSQATTQPTNQGIKKPTNQTNNLNNQIANKPTNHVRSYVLYSYAIFLFARLNEL
jgi:hypothetical protein